jgi:integral membrane protein
MHDSAATSNLCNAKHWYSVRGSKRSCATSHRFSIGRIVVLNPRQFAWLAFAEAGSFVLLLIGMVFKYGFDNETGVSIMGPIHGVLFIAYIIGALVVRGAAGWSWGHTAKMVLAGIVPIAGFFVGERLMRQPASAQAA